MSNKTRFPRAAAIAVAKQMCDVLEPLTVKLIVAGSLRRRKMEVGDVEILYIPRLESRPDGLFDTKDFNLVDEALEKLLNAGTICKRTNVNGSQMWGPKNKLAAHVASGIPIDFFSATEENWFNNLVCRTGGAESNTRIASAAQNKGWKWNPYGPGFTNIAGKIIPVTSEQDVFSFLNLPYEQPWERP